MKNQRSAFSVQRSGMKTNPGYFTLLVLVYSAVFITLLSALSGFIFVEKRAQLAKEAREQALHLAEAGIEYYRWFLAHNPGDLTDGTGLPGPYVHTVPDPEGGNLGKFSLVIEGETFCDTVGGITITSTGWTDSQPNYKRTIVTRYTQPTVAEYSHIVNSNVWAASDRIISGPYHSNGGIRMDGTHNATISSGVQTWSCTATFGCNPTADQNGVFGTGSNPELWQFPVAPIDFQGISADIALIQEYAEDHGGLHFGPRGGESNRRGYHATFNADGTVSVRNVNGTTRVWGYTTENGWQYDYPVISSEDSPTTYQIPDECPVLFFEDRVWIDGVVSGKVVLVSADISQPNYDTDVVLNGNLTYASGSQTDGITVVAERHIQVGLQTPDTMTINGIFIAQNGRFGRNHYEASGSRGLPSSLDPYVTRSTLNTLGTVVSNFRVGTKWISNGVYVSGYAQRTDSYDTNLAANPPPFTPTISDDFKLVEWREQN